ncbi:MAG: hypothetical protein GX879_10800, partial [Bacteroidales bacterium]|nr:hypothetical protein [Bacteroidales bacterium]
YHLMDIETEYWSKEFKELENNSTDYIEIERWTSSEAFQVMSDFADLIPDYRLKSRLFYALSKKKPFAEFKFVIDHSGHYRQEWFKFRDKWQQEFVAELLEDLNASDE